MRNHEAMNARAIQTTVPRDVAEAIDRLAREQMIPKSAVVRQLLVRRVREVQQRQPAQEVPQ
jgi:hypothetical protein